MFIPLSVQKYFGEHKTENKDSISTLQVDPIVESLTKREKEILELVKQGYSNKELAELKNLDKTTIESHLRNIKEKLGFKKMHELRKHIKNLQ
ncbi:MAG: LuxR C-terminal-related transcriptional regulator [Bacteroidota bacterium]